MTNSNIVTTKIEKIGMKKMTKEYSVMNTSLECFGMSEQKEFQVLEWMQQIEKNFSRFNLESELSKLNNSNSELMTVSPLMLEILLLSYKYYNETEKLFNPFAGNFLIGLGYSSSFEQLDSTSSTQNVINATDFALENKPIEFFLDRSSVKLSKNTKIDLGGIAKGWAAQKAFQQLKMESINSGLINAGGDIILWGDNNPDGWGIEISNPFGEKSIGDLWFKSKTAAIATSSTMKRKWNKSDGKTYHHIIDTRTGQSSDSDLVQVTVIAPDLVTAEVYTKCLLILGSEAGVNFIDKKRPDLGYIIVKKDGIIIKNEQIKNYCYESEVEYICSK